MKSLPEARSSQASAAKPLSAVGKAIELISAIATADNPGLSVSEVARETGMPKATSHRILKTLTDSRVIDFDPAAKTYFLGPRLLGFGLAAIRKLDVPRIARPYLQLLADHTSETATLSIRQGSYRLYLDQIPSTQEIKMTVPLGVPFPLYAGASSRAILSTLSEEELREYLEEVALVPLTTATLLNKAAITAQVEEARLLGYTTSRGERQQDASSVAAPIRSADGSTFGAISVCGPLQRFERLGTHLLGRMVRDYADKISGEMGYHPRQQGQ